MVRLAILGALALSPAADWRSEPIKALYSAPQSAGEPIAASVVVRYNSDGYLKRECELIKGSGDPVADANPCGALPTMPTKGALEMAAPVWMAPTHSGVYRGPIAASDPSSWLRVSDLSTAVFTSTNFVVAVVRVNVDATGTVSRCNVAVPSGNKPFDATLKRRFCPGIRLLPATLDGEPVGAVLLFALRYFSPPDV